MCFLILRKKPQNQTDAFPTDFHPSSCTVKRGMSFNPKGRGGTRAIWTACCTRADKARDAPQ